MSSSMDAKASACALTCVVTDQFVWGAQARIISTQIASRFCWCSLPSDGAVCGPRHRRGYLSDGHRPQAWMASIARFGIAQLGDKNAWSHKHLRGGEELGRLIDRA